MSQYAFKAGDVVVICSTRVRQQLLATWLDSLNLVKHKLMWFFDQYLRRHNPKEVSCRGPNGWSICHGPSAAVHLSWSVCLLWSISYGLSVMVSLSWLVCHGPSVMVHLSWIFVMVHLLWSIYHGLLVLVHLLWCISHCPSAMIHLSRSIYCHGPSVAVHLSRSICHGPYVMIHLSWSTCYSLSICHSPSVMVHSHARLLMVHMHGPFVISQPSIVF